MEKYYTETKQQTLSKPYFLSATYKPNHIGRY